VRVGSRRARGAQLDAPRRCPRVARVAAAPRRACARQGQGALHPARPGLGGHAGGQQLLGAGVLRGPARLLPAHAPGAVARGRGGPARPGRSARPSLRVRELPPCLPRRASGRGRLPRTEPSAAPSGGWPLPGAERQGARRRAGQQGGCHPVSTGSSGARPRLPAPVARSAAPAEPAAAAAAAKAARARSCSRTTWRSTCAGTCACRPSATTSTCSARCCARRRATTRSPTSRCRPAAPVAVPSGCTGAVRAGALGQWRPGRRAGAVAPRPRWGRRGMARPPGGPLVRAPAGQGAPRQRRA